MDKYLLPCYNSFISYESAVCDMPFSLLPDVITDALTDLTPELLRRYDIKLLMLDFDNTIVPYTTDIPTQDMIAWIQKMQTSEIKLCVVSNSKRGRVVSFCKKYGIRCIINAKKPGTMGLRKCMAQFGIAAENAALVGDQIFTDTLAANCAGVRSILVRAIHNHNFWLKLRHVAELPFIHAAKGRRLNDEKY